MYGAEEQVETLFSYFAFLAIFISCLGLFGLSSFMTEQRTKEIGVRKVVGASIPDLVILLSRDFSKWVILSFIFACPVAYIAMSSWLQNYAYKTNITWWMFILAGIIALIVAFLTVSYQTFNVSRKNPIEALRYE